MHQTGQTQASFSGDRAHRRPSIAVAVEHRQRRLQDLLAFGFADFPKYPINLLADLNALAGIVMVHGSYPTLTPEQLATAIPVDTSADYTGHTSYWMIPYADGQLPLTDLIAAIPVVGKPLADLLEPDLAVLVNLGYGPDPDIGWSTTGANLPTPFGLSPSLTFEQFGTVFDDLVSGAQKGAATFMTDLAHLPAPSGASMLADPTVDPLPATDPLTSLTDTVNTLTGALSSAYAALLPTADIVNALVTTLPAYDISLFVQELTAGHLLDAVGLPIAADMGLVTVAAGFELLAIQNAITGVALF